MPAVKFENVCIESYAFNRPPNEISSASIEDKLAELYKKYRIPFGTLEKLSGIKSRKYFGTRTPPSEIATEAAKMALEKCDIGVDQLGAVINCSVTRDYFEPATGILVHRNLGCKEEVMALDLTNACVGFSNGMMLLGNLIESGVVKAGLLTSGESMGGIMENTFKKLLDPENKIPRKEFTKVLPTFTLGSGGVAMVMCHKDLATQNHRYLGSLPLSASEGAEYCIGNGDFCILQADNFDPLMETDSKKLINSAMHLGARAWKSFSEIISWDAKEIDHIVCHQVGKQVNEEFYTTQGLPHDREHTIYQDYGNLVSAAMPAALIDAAESGKYMTGDKILLTGYGSGLNTIFSGLVW